MQPIITKDDVANYLPLAKSCAVSDIDFQILEQQSLTLKKWLGDCFFFEYEEKFAEEKFEILLNGGEYQKDGRKYCEPLKKVLAYLAYAEYVIYHNYTDTPFGMKIKNFQDGLPTPPEMLETLRARYRNKAIEYFESCKEYLCENKEYFCYKGDCSQSECGKCNSENKNIKIRTLY